jgi:uncharacterized protein YbaP (TraB family)
MKCFLSTLALLAFSFLPQHIKAQQTSSKTLLWRISGNGMQKPSYLYGTMHLKDRRLFFFGDSVYKSIETAEGFAMELDPNEMMDSLFTKMGKGDTTTLLRKLLDEKKFKSVSKKLEKKFGMPADKISRKKLIEERENWYYNIHKSDDMKSVVDLYLYDIAHKQGKWVGGIEDVNDQFGIKDELGKDVNIAEYVDDDNEEKKKDYLEKMISIYADQDLEELDLWVSGSQSQKSKDLLLVNRNIKMAYRMDSLAHVRTSFFAVGAAHLPGESGLISLLQSKGFSVTPVFSSKKITPEKYVYDAKEIPWVKFSEPEGAYSVEMPAKPSDLKTQGGEVNFKIYADLVSNTVYMSGFSFVGTDEKRGDMMDRMIKSFASKGFDKKEERKISNKGIEGNEMIAVMEKVYYRFQIFSMEDKVFIAMAGAEKRDNLFANDAERFFKSLTMNASLVAKPNSWVNYKDSSKAFDISFPKKPGIDKLKVNETDKNFETNSYTAFDIANNTYYMVVVSDTKKGYVISDDSTIFNVKLSYFKEQQSPISDLRYFTIDGNQAMSFSAQSKQEGLDYISKLLVVCRGNRSYTVAAITQKGKEDYPDITRFFRSFQLSPYRQNKWSEQKGYGNAFSTWAPSSLDTDKPDTTGLSGQELEDALTAATKRVQVLAHEPYSTTTYNVNIYPLSKYYWAKSDSSFLADQIATYFSDSNSANAKAKPGQYDSLVYKKEVTNGQVKGLEILVKNAAKSYYKRVRVFAHGDSVYHLFVMAAYDIVTNENNNKFFDDFRFSKEDLSSNILKNKTAGILANLESKDSATLANARTAIENAPFEATDLPLLHQAYLKTYPVDTTNYYNSVNEIINDAINKVHDSSTVAFVKRNYVSGTTQAPELKMDMLDMLASQQTKTAVATLKELLLKDPPPKGNASAFIYQLADSLTLSVDLFPEVGQFFGDSILGPGMIRLASDLIDSNLLQKDILQQYMGGIFHTANAQLVKLKKDKEDYPAFNSYVIDVLEKLNSLQSNGLLNGFAKVGDLYTKQSALLALLKNKQPVPAVEINKIAADKGYRTSFYSALKKIGKQQLFPAAFFTQPLFAEGYIYNYIDDDDAENVVCKLLGERLASVKGAQQRFYLFKVSFEYDGEVESHLAVCGKFDLNKKKVEVKDEDLTIKVFYDSKFEPATITKLFDQYVKDENLAAATPALKE